MGWSKKFDFVKNRIAKLKEQEQVQAQTQVQIEMQEQAEKTCQKEQAEKILEKKPLNVQPEIPPELKIMFASPSDYRIMYLQTSALWYIDMNDKYFKRITPLFFQHLFRQSLTLKNSYRSGTFDESEYTVRINRMRKIINWTQEHFSAEELQRKYTTEEAEEMLLGRVEYPKERKPFVGYLAYQNLKNLWEGGALNFSSWQDLIRRFYPEAEYDERLFAMISLAVAFEMFEKLYYREFSKPENEAQKKQMIEIMEALEKTLICKKKEVKI